MTAVVSHSDRLQSRMDFTCGQLPEAYHRLWNRSDLAAVLQPFLILMHQIIRASVPLMNLAQSIAAERAGLDPVCARLAPYLAQHCEEEQNHDEWLLEDLQAAGIPPALVIGEIPHASVAALVGAQYYWIQHYHPVALLGYMRLLEGYPPTVGHVERLQRVSGLPAAMFRTYRLHGELDPGHLEEMNAFIDSLPLSEVHSDLIWISVSHTASALTECLDQLSPSRRVATGRQADISLP